MSEKNSQVVFLSEHRLSRPPQKAPTVKSAGLELSPLKKRQLNKILEDILATSNTTYELVFFSAALASSVVKACQRAGCSSAPWHMANLYEKMMRDEEDGTA